MTQLPLLTSIDMSGELRCFIQTLIENIKTTNVINKKFLSRSINKFYNGFEPFIRNETQRTALIEMQIAKEEALGIEPRHHVAHKLKTQADEHTQWQEEENNKDLDMTRELQSAAL
jgi:hypothetical protein